MGRVLILCVLVASCKASCGSHAKDSGEGDKRVANLAYMAEVPVADETANLVGVTVGADTKDQSMNLFVPGTEGVAVLMDMRGKERHRWETRDEEKTDTWQFAVLGPDKALYVLTKRELLKLDWNGKELLRVVGNFHHTVAFAENGDLLTLNRARRLVNKGGKTYEILDDLLVRMSPSGKRIAEFSVYDRFGDAIKQHVFTTIDEQPAALLECLDSSDEIERVRCLASDTPNDVLHTNSIGELTEPIPPIAQAGDYLISIRNVNTIAILSPDGKIRWRWADKVHRQHHPTVVEDGRILLFDNRAGRRGAPASRVVEIVPQTGEIVWTYRGTPPESFFSRKRGAAQRLPSGNTLITESDKGHAFEVTRTGQIVWEYWSARRGKRRAAIYRMTRIPAEVVKTLPLVD